MRKLSNKICVVLLAFIMFTAFQNSYVKAETSAGGQVSGVVSGFQEEDVENVQIVLYNSSNAYQASISEDGTYAFSSVEAGEYFLKVEVAGYKVPSPVETTVSAEETVTQNLEVTPVEGTDYYYQWKADSTYFGYEESATVPEKKKVTFLEEDIYVPDSNAANKLVKNYKFYLSNEDVAWSSDYSSRMLELINTIPNMRCDKPSKWILTKEYIDNDIIVTYGEECDVVIISESAFTNAVPRKASMNGLKGTFFSNRLYHALVRYVTKEGTDTDFIDEIFKEKFGCSIKVPDYEALTKGITDETEAAFEQFKPEELLAMLNMFEEMPSGFHKVEGLEYLVRRIDGQRHPIYPESAAVSWVYAETGYIEFMDSAFLGSEVEDTFRLILHEKCHFLWKNVFSEELKHAWQEVGGWYETDSDSDGWATTKQTEFVTAYAHAHNPDEDMAESIAYYILMPDKLESRSIDKYNFVKNYIMNGEIYISQIREDLTFEVYNLYPDYSYPGRIVEMDIDVKGGAMEDKEVTVTVTLDTQGDKANGATSGFLRMTSSADTYEDLWLSPIDEGNSVLQGKITFSKYACDGFWYCEQITLSDESGNQRFEGVDDFGWKMYINNALADIEKPEYIEDSLRVETSSCEVEGEVVTYIDILMDVKDNIGVKNVYCEIANNTHNSYRMDQWGEPQYEVNKNNVTTMRIRYVFTKYFQSGEYSINFLNVIDLAGNEHSYNFYRDGSGAKSYTTFYYESEYSDYEPPELDVNNITINAYPTNPDNPNGETVVNIDYYVKDNKAGLGQVNYTLLDPLGKTHFQYHYHENFYTMFFDGDPTAWKKYHIQVILPAGSAPGIWGLLELSLWDKAGNQKTYNFLEIVHFVVDDSSLSEENQTYVVSSESDELFVDDKMQMSFAEADSEKEYVWECIAGTGVALIDQKGVLTGVSPGTVVVLIHEKEDENKYGTKVITILEAQPTPTVEPEATPVVIPTTPPTATPTVEPEATPVVILTTTLTASSDNNNFSKEVGADAKEEEPLFVIKLEKTSIKDIENCAKKKVRCKIKKVKYAKGYQVYYATNKKFSKKKKMNVKNTTFILKKLKKKKTYYIRVRAYRYRVEGGKKIYGAWSSVKKIKIKR